LQAAIILLPGVFEGGGALSHDKFQRVSVQQKAMGETGAAILFGFVGLVLGFTIAGLISKRQTADSKLTPVITGIIQPNVGSHLSRIPADLRHK
jgi:hypothetical protein